MPRERVLRAGECTSAARVQEAIDQVAAAGGGRVILPALDLVLDRGLELRSGVELAGQGDRTVLRKAPGRVYPLTGYHNYGMCDAPLASTAGLEPGMTVSVHDRLRRGFYSTFARITWVDGGWVGLDHGIEADYAADQEPVLTTAFPLVFGHGIAGAALRDLCLDGARSANPDTPMDGCRGAAVYFARSRDIDIAGIRERAYHGEGLGFQMCRDIRVRDCAFCGNAGNGLHPGAGSTGALFEGCTADGNDGAGFFFCVRATRISVRGCRFRGNAGPGVSIGTRDCHNLVERCDIAGNGGPGVLCRRSPRPVEVHSCRVEGNRLSGNARRTGRAEIEILDDSHDLIVRGNTLRGDAAAARAALAVEGAVRGVHLEGNRVEGLALPEAGSAFAAAPPQFECGYESLAPEHARHLP